MSTLLRLDANAKRLIFIGGAEGSGTTLLLRLLSVPDVCVSLGGNLLKVPAHPDAGPLAHAFEDANRRLWNRKLSRSDHERARRDWHAATEQILGSPAFLRQTHLIFKRSFPFALPRDQYTPDIWDTLDLLSGTRIAIIYRDPCAATFSTLRRGFDSDLRRLAVACSEQLTWLAGQVRAIGPDLVRVISYRSLCDDPAAILAPLTEFCDIPFDPVRIAALTERMDVEADARYSRELDRPDVEWLEGFFDTRRRRQWDILASGVPAPV
jgi:Sulfotransferase family